MKLYATIENEKGKREGLGSNKRIIVEVRRGNSWLGEISLEHDATSGETVVNWNYRQQFTGNPKSAELARVFENVPDNKTIKARLEHLRRELRAERISYGELAELQGLARYIDPSDNELLEAAGVPEGAHMEWCQVCEKDQYHDDDRKCLVCEEPGKKQQGEEINHCVTCGGAIASGQVSQRHCKKCLHAMGY